MGTAGMMRLVVVWVTGLLVLGCDEEIPGFLLGDAGSAEEATTGDGQSAGDTATEADLIEADTSDSDAAASLDAGTDTLVELDAVPELDAGADSDDAGADVDDAGAHIDDADLADSATQLDAAESDTALEPDVDPIVDVGVQVDTVTFDDIVTEQTECQVHSDCKAGNSCSGWRCNELDKTCENVYGPADCCTEASDCDDGNPCTKDTCYYPGLGACIHNPDTVCPAGSSCLLPTGDCEGP